jgi:hypothetical protein
MRGLLTFTIATILGGAAAQGHHSIAAAYDRDRPVKLDGVLVQFAMVQPHPYVVVDIKDGGDTIRWRGELDNRWELVAIGMNDETLKPGDRLVVSGSIGRNQPRTLYVWRLDRPADGFWYEQVGMSPKIGFYRGG